MKIIENDEIKNNLYRNIKFLKEDLERLYIDERKSLTEISRIYGCSPPTIKIKLEKYGISTRPQGAFLVDDDGETLSSKYVKGEIGVVEYKSDLLKRKGFKNYGEYRNYLASKKGFEDVNDYNREMRYKKGENLSMSENKKCAQYLGIYICENKEFLSKIINIVESMKCNNPGYDVICGKGKKIDVKCSCLRKNNKWDFRIDKNKISDYFLIISFDNRESLNVQHIWLIKGNSYIEKSGHRLSEDFIFNEKTTVTIGTGKRSLRRWKRHEITDSYKLEEAQKLCDTFKNNNGDLSEL